MSFTTQKIDAKVMGTVNEQGQLALDSPLLVETQSRVEVIVLIPEDIEVEDDNPAKEEILNDFRQALQESKNGETIPIEQLWND